jgi:oxygen-independent coproporphyrinogen-3 oxidase
MFDGAVDSVYFGGGTPTLLDISQLERIFVSIRQNFDLQKKVEITMECAPGTLSEEKAAALARCGVNRVSLGVQSFVDREAASVGRLHKRGVVMEDIARLREAGISNINVDLIAGLPHQTRESWEQSLNDLFATDVPHASVYMLEVDEDSRLGRELIAGGQKYHAHHVPDEDLTAEMYEIACDQLNAAGLEQYELSNFARPGFESKHNLKYWTRQPYLGFGVDAHSMLHRSSGGAQSVRFSNPDALESYVAGAHPACEPVSSEAALQESFFLGLRMNRGVSLASLTQAFGASAVSAYRGTIAELVSSGMLLADEDVVRLSNRGRLVSNGVFERFISVPAL